MDSIGDSLSILMEAEKYSLALKFDQISKYFLWKKLRNTENSPHMAGGLKKCCDKDIAYLWDYYIIGLVGCKCTIHLHCVKPINLPMYTKPNI